jgi:membrane-bound lytic murein transglycosylase A
LAAGRRAQRLKRPWFFALALAGCAQPQTPSTPTQWIVGGSTLAPIPVSALPGWNNDATAAALTAFIRGCRVIDTMPADQSLGGTGLIQQTAGQAGLWQNVCNGAEDVSPVNDTSAKNFFEAYFTAYQLGGTALITGYFEPEYPGSKNLAPGYRVPIYGKPDDPDLAALPRTNIDHGALYRKAPVTAYLADPVDAYMLQIEGAGRILLPNGNILRVGYDGQNGQPNTHIGSILVTDGDLTANDVSFQSIDAWLKDNPDQAKSIMEQNANYVFLRPLGALPDDEGAPGALGAPLTAGRSLAVDNTNIALGTPIYLATTDPTTNAPLDRLTFAQDTAGGIHGTGAAELFFGGGSQAEATAGRMKQSGTLYLLLPRPTPTS